MIGDAQGGLNAPGVATFPSGGLTTDLPTEISWNNLFGGFTGKQVLGPVFPTGMTLKQLALFLDNADYTGQLGIALSSPQRDERTP